MKKLAFLAGVVAPVAILAGCSTAGGGGSSGASSTQTLSAQSAVNAYLSANPTTYSASGPTSSQGALEQAGGNAGLGIGTNGSASAADGNFTFKVGNIAIDRGNEQSADDDTLTLTIGNGRSLTLKSTNKNLYGETFGYETGKSRGKGDGVSLARIPAELTEHNKDSYSSYVSLVSHYKDATWDSEDESITSAKELNLFVTGLLTPEGSMPTAKADYFGEWGLVSGDSPENLYSNRGSFDVSADFASQTLSGKAGEGNILDGNNPASTNLSGTISGNTFSGKATRINTDGLDGTFGGAFFGPSAEQIGGTGVGTIVNDGAETDASVVFAGSQKK